MLLLQMLARVRNNLLRHDVRVELMSDLWQQLTDAMHESLIASTRTLSDSTCSVAFERVSGMRDGLRQDFAQVRVLVVVWGGGGKEGSMRRRRGSALLCLMSPVDLQAYEECMQENLYHRLSTLVEQFADPSASPLLYPFRFLYLKYGGGRESVRCVWVRPVLLLCETDC